MKNTPLKSVTKSSGRREWFLWCLLIYIPATFKGGAWNAIERTQGRLQQVMLQPVQDIARIVSILALICWPLAFVVRGPELLDSSIYLHQLDIWPGFWGVFTVCTIALVCQSVMFVLDGAPGEGVADERRGYTSPIYLAGNASFYLTFGLFGSMSVILSLPGVTPGTFGFGFLALSQLWGIGQRTYAINVAHRKAERRQLIAERKRRQSDALGQSATT